MNQVNLEGEGGSSGADLAPLLRVSPQGPPMGGLWGKPPTPLPAQLGMTGPSDSLLRCCPWTGPLTELGPIQKFSCWIYFTLSYTPLFLST